MIYLRLRTAFTIACLAALLAGSTLPGPASAQRDDFPRTVTDATGATITIPARPDTVLTLGDSPELRAAVEPDALRTADPIAGPDAAAWDGVGLLVLSDLYAAAYPGWLDAAAERGVPVFQVSALAGLDEWRAAVQALGRAAGRDIRAASALARLEARLVWLGTRLQTETLRRTLVLTPEGYTFGQHTLITELIAAAGGVNVAAEAGYADYRQIDAAAIVALAPDVILLSPAWSNDERATLLADPALADLPAVQHRRVHRLSFSPTLPDDPAAAALVLALALHPHAMLP